MNPQTKLVNNIFIEAILRDACYRTIKQADLLSAPSVHSSYYNIEKGAPIGRKEPNLPQAYSPGPGYSIIGLSAEQADILESGIRAILETCTTAENISIKREVYPTNGLRREPISLEGIKETAIRLFVQIGDMGKVNRDNAEQHVLTIGGKAGEQLAAK